ncbi:MAG: hypothetical protein MUF64_28320 [Polyangiaceae bacterium]|nr:hypothetical protein [Polyangiaceae bacterium]
MSRRGWATLVLHLGNLLPAAPVALVGASLVGALWGEQGGDGVLWKPGGAYLLETLRLLAPTGGALAWMAPWYLLLWVVTGVVPQGLALGLLGARADEAPWGRGWRAVPALVVVLGASLLGRVVALALCLLAARALGASLSRFSDPVRFWGLAPLVLIALGLLGVIQALQDLAAAAAVRREERGPGALLTALEVLHRRPWAALGPWAWRAALAWGLLGGAALVGELGGGALLRQGALLAACWLRVGWWCRALGLIDGAPDPRERPPTSER